jgi:leucyl aminopeptidase
MAVDGPPVPVLVAPRRGALRIISGPALVDCTGALLVVGVWAKTETNVNSHKDTDGTEFVLPAEVAEFDSSSFNGALAEAVTDAEFKAKSGSSSETVRVSGAAVKRVLLYGLGNPNAIDAGYQIAKAAAFAVGKAASFKSCTSVALYIENLSRDQVAKVAEGAHVGAYVDERYKEKTSEASKIPEEIVLVGADVVGIADIGSAAETGIAIAAGIVTTKEVVASPANFLNPTTMAIAARQVAEEEGLDCKILGRKECHELGMGALLGVSQGAAIEPQFIHMTYRGHGAIRKRVAIVGKTVCHDTGGYNLKAGPGSMIELMKWDMGGGGATLGAARAIGMCK